MNLKSELSHIFPDKTFFQNLNENLNESSIIQPINKNISNTCNLQNKLFSDLENAKSNSTSGRVANSSMQTFNKTSKKGP